MESTADGIKQKAKVLYERYFDIPVWLVSPVEVDSREFLSCHPDWNNVKSTASYRRGLRQKKVNHILVLEGQMLTKCTNEYGVLNLVSKKRHWYKM